MRLFILQIVIKQWDKSQRTETHESRRAKIPVQYSINFPPAFYVFDKHCVIDQHGDANIMADRASLSLTDIIGCMKKSL